MNELLAAAKAVIDLYEYTGTIEECEAVNRLYDAVERAENPLNDFDKWWGQTEIWPSEYTAAASAWIAAQQAERERIRARVRLAAISSWSASEVYIGPPFIQLQKFVEALLEDGDAN